MPPDHYRKKTLDRIMVIWKYRIYYQENGRGGRVVDEDEDEDVDGLGDEAATVAAAAAAAALERAILGRLKRRGGCGGWLCLSAVSAADALAESGVAGRFEGSCIDAGIYEQEKDKVVVIGVGLV